MNFMKFLGPKMTIFIKFNSFSVFFTIIIIIFVCSYGFYGLSKGGYEYMTSGDTDAAWANNKPGKTTLLLFGSGYTKLLGVLGGGLVLPVGR